MSSNPYQPPRATADHALGPHHSESSARVAELPPLAWWESRRLRYNAALAAAGIVAFICYVLVCCTLLPRVLPAFEIEVSLFTTLFQGVGYLFMMGLANVCYFLGPLSEHLIRPRNVQRYRRICYGVGLWFSVLLPFAIPVLLAILVLLFPGNWKHSA
jgi:hypothetical protein